jgi:hypothetical protein
MPMAANNNARELLKKLGQFEYNGTEEVDAFLQVKPTKQ